MGVHRDQHQLQTDGLLHPRFARAACIFLPFHQGKGNSLSSGRRSNQRYRKFSVSNRRYSVKEYRIILDLTKCHQIKSKWHKREFNKQCSVWWYNLSEQERERFQEMADRSNATNALNATSYTTQVQHVQQGQTQVVQNAVSSTTATGGQIPSFGTSFTYSDYGIQGGAGGQVVNAVVDNTGTVLNYSTNAAPGTQQVIQQGGRQVVVQGGTVVQRPATAVATPQQTKPSGKPMKDPNAPKKPLSAYFLFSQDERLKVKAEFADYSITDVAKELGRRWATIDPLLKQQYEQRYQSARKVFDQEMSAYKPHKKKKDPNAPKQPLSAYFIFSTEERLKVKNENPNFSICEVAKELGRRWAEMDPSLKQRFQARAEEGRQKYDVEMAAYRQGTFQHPDPAEGHNSPNHPSPAPSPSYPVQDSRPQQSQQTNYSGLLQ